MISGEVLNNIYQALEVFFGAPFMQDTFFRFFIDLSVFLFLYSLAFSMIFFPVRFILKLIKNWIDK